MTSYVHTLTELETACGVTLEDVARELPRGVFREGGRRFVVSVDIGPALAASVARCAFAGEKVTYEGRTLLGHAYELSR